MNDRVTELVFASDVKSAIEGAEIVVVAAPKKALDAGFHCTALGTPWAASLDRAVEDAKPGDMGGLASTYGPDGAPRRLIVAALPDTVSRHNSPTRSESLKSCLDQARLGGRTSAVVICVDDAAHYAAVAITAARALPVFSMATKKKDDKKTKKSAARCTVVVCDRDGKAIAVPADAALLADAIRFSSRLIDTPPDQMRTSHFEEEARAAVKGMKNVKIRSIVGDALLAEGMGGIHGVGRCAEVAPRLVVIEYTPKKKARRTVALVGKGIIYDTGGLDLKVGGSMPQMKCDMSGAAAVLGAFLVLAKTNCPDRVVALCCMAENAIGPASYRSDDILTFHSGKTVEINNTDAEGRLVLADGVSYAARDMKADLVVDIATLTGAAKICTGNATSCTISNREGVERLAVECGRAVGDLTFPLIFAPEFFRAEFASKVADMKNSVKDRMNAQSSAAGQFIYNHIEDLDRPWLHLDIAGPAFRGERGQGHGVGLMVEIVRRLDDAHMKS
ncbi:MAG: leucyl aminopeptidase family protein [Planctomycetes bacterium]|nr:leucyl aminopeptidase family protein [Planctomycetota bacterium]